MTKRSKPDRFLCGAGQFQVDGGQRNIVYCHYSKRRKAQGSAFAAHETVYTAKFRAIIQEGNDVRVFSTQGSIQIFSLAL